ncbi:centrosomal protein of 295 kDa isoform X1 [Psammomys obesus]|uniref:centrosomal protein of 295 kDa isoform X1 n=1 Tax=Psammomys obesus TaxID=48139 RepID=UPI0024529ED8|nr:centrosomal protein of 295 kDa isoform X1 [Psammomys obesus]
MTEVTRAWRWPSHRCPNRCWVVCSRRVPECGEVRPRLSSDPLYYTEMKRKVMNNGKLRLSPNEEAFILKEDYERRRKLRLLQVREQERSIAFQIREDIKQRRNQQFSRLAEELRTEWEEAQSQRIQKLEKLYLASLKHLGEGHRQAKENEPDLDTLAQRAAERKRKAEMRHKEALRMQKNEKEMLMKQKTRNIKARKEALLVEKERSAKMARLPPPVPAPFENIEVNRIPSLKTNSSTYHHISAFVSRQPDAHLAAEEEARRLEGLRKQAVQERMEQLERAHVRGSQAMKKIHLAQNQERLMEELEQLQKEDLARRRQTVAQMPPQLVELPYRRSELKEDWQRELEFAFEDMYNADRKVKGNLILHLKPQPLPTISEHLQDEELDLSMEQENQGETENLQVRDTEIICPSGTVSFATKTQQIPARILFKRLLNKIRSQQSLWTIKSVSEDEGEMTTSTSEIESKAASMESGAIATEEGTLFSEQEQVTDSDRLTIESGPLSSEDKLFFYQAGAGKEQAMAVSPPVTTVAQSSVLLHPQEEAVRIRMSARHKQIMEIEEQKQKQLELLEQIEQQKLRLETDCFRAQLEEEEKQKKTQFEVCPASMSHAMISDEDCHRQMIRNYQHQLLQQNRLHKQSVETARKRLLEYQTVLKERCLPVPAISLAPDSVVLGPPQKSQKSAAASEHWDPSQRLKLSPTKCQPVQPSHTPALDHGDIQLPGEGHFPQRQGETGTSEKLTKQSVESQEHRQQFSQAEMHEKDSESIPEDSQALSRTLSSDRPLVLACSFASLPVKLESGKIQKPLKTINQSVITQMPDQPLSFSETSTAQQGDLKVLQEQLELQKEVLQARQEAQEKLLLYKQKELEKQTALQVFLPSSSSVGNLLPSLSSASAESGEIQASSTESDGTVSSGNVDRLWGVSQPISSQQTSSEFLQEQFSVQKDNLQARREAQEVMFAHKQSKLDEIVCPEQAGPSWPHQVAQQSFSSLTLASKQSRKIQEQPLPTNKIGLFPSQSETSKSQDGSSAFLQQTLPLHRSLKFLRERLTAQMDTIQPRHDTQEALLLHRESALGGSRAGPVNSLFSVFAHHSDASRAVSEAGSKRFQEQYSSGKENIVPPSHPITPELQEESRGFPQHSLPRQHFITLQDQAHIPRFIHGSRKEIQEFSHKLNELEKGLCSQQSGTLSSPSQVVELERSQEFISVSDSTGPLSHFKIPGFQERLVRFSQHTFPLPDNFHEHQEWVDMGKESCQLSSQTRENSFSQQTGFSPFIPSLGLPLGVSLPSADSITQGSLSTESSSRVTSNLQLPELQGRLLKISQLIHPQQDSLKVLQEQLAAQREAIIHSRQEALEEALREWKERIFPEQVGLSSPLKPQCSLASFPLSDSERTQELCSTISDEAISSSRFEIMGLPDRALGLSHTALPQQDDLTAQPEHRHAQTNLFCSTEETQEKLVFPRPCKFEEMSAEHFIQPHHGDLKTFQQQLDRQRKGIRFGQEIQEELLLQRFNKLEQRVSSEQISSFSFSSQKALPIVNSEDSLQSFPDKKDGTDIPRYHSECLSFSQPLLPPQDNLAEQLDLEMVFHKELLLHKQNSKNKSESPEHTFPALFLSKEIEHPFIPLPFAEAKSKSICELYLSKKEHEAPSNDGVIPRLQDSLLSSFQPALIQQDNMSLQKQLNLQREALYSRQRAQEELHVQTQTALQQQIEKHRETLKDFFNVSQARQPSGENDLKMQRLEQLTGWFPHIQGLAWGDSDQESPSDEQPCSADVHAEYSGESLDKELSGRASKPPVSKVKFGLDLNQHELSTIQEVESPASGRTSILGKADFYQGRDPLRVSVSREQSFLGSPLAHDPFGCHQPPAQDNSRSHDDDEAVQVKESDVENHAVLSHAVSEEEKEACTYLGPIVKLDDKAETQEISQEPLSSVTFSTGSFLSYEITDLSLTDTESFSEQTEHQEEESTSKQEETDPFSCTVPSTQVIYYQQRFLRAHESLLPTEEESTFDHTHVQQIIDKDINEADLIPEKRDFQVPAVDLDFPELEHLFPHLHRLLFKPLEPHLDFDLSSSSGISQDNKDFYQSSESSSENHVFKASSTSTVDFTALRSLPSDSRLNQQLEANLAQGLAAEGSEQSFQQLLPEFSQESQHDDLPSIHSIEARGTSQSMESQNFFEQTEIVNNKKRSVHTPSLTENLTPACSPSNDATLFHQSHMQHSTPCGSISSECSVKQLETKEMLGFEELSRTVAMSQSQRPIEDENVQDSKLYIGTVEMETSTHGPNSLSIQNEKPIQNVIKTETTKAVTNMSQLAQAEHITNSESHSFRIPIPVWETESGYGIMEEPDLTLVSTSDISVAETDLANLTLEEKDNEAQSCPQAGGFLPLLSSETSIRDVLEPCVDQPTVAPSAISSSSQDSFMKERTSMEQSYQRQMRNKGSFLSRLKGVNKVRASLPEERKARQALINQKALRYGFCCSFALFCHTCPHLLSCISNRLYRQFAEVKQQREEKAKQEVGDQSTARAKEFHKETLQKLRAKYTC